MRVRGDTTNGCQPTAYTIYLPQDYLARPTRPRAVLLLVPGGRGNRTRWFLEPTSANGLTEGTGGLAMRRRMDEWNAAHPEAPVPLVVALDGPGRWTRALLGRAFLEHVLQTYLPHQTRATTPVGVESISAGAVAVLTVLHDDPRAFQSVGLVGLYCDEGGLLPSRDLGPRRQAFYADLAARRRANEFALRFDIGERDEFYGCNYALYREMSEAGLFPSEQAVQYSDCRPGARHPSPRHCVTQRPGFVSYPRLGHHYTELLPALPDALAWNLDELIHRPVRVGGDAARVEAVSQREWIATSSPDPE